MRKLNSVNFLCLDIIDRFKKSENDIFIILIGGYSRSGKSTLTYELANILYKSGFYTTVLNLDSWLVDVDKRDMDSTVYERYDTKAICRSINSLLEGASIYPPVYNPLTRKRISECADHPVSIMTGILIIEGVITLSIPDLLNRSDLNIFVDISNCLRLKRLIDFYGYTKKLKRSDYKKIIRDREKEEVPFIQNSAQVADIIFEW